MTEDLVDTCIPGDLITVSGIVRFINADVAAGKTNKRAMANSLFLLYVEANAVQTGRRRVERHAASTASASTSTTPSDPEEDRGDEHMGMFTVDELHQIREIAMDEDSFAWVVHSLCPAIFGHENVKAGLALGLFGGSRNDDNQKDKLSVRSDPHILVVGDPGLGKSQMLRAVSQISPRSVYVSANTTTASGLTVTVSKERGPGNDVALEAGALVLSDQGLCCIDEFDKIGCDHHCLLEAMEQQQVSIAKAGVVATLSARCSVIAAANPVGGHYDSRKTISENLKMSTALLSRFDLVFILLDKPETEHDRMWVLNVWGLGCVPRAAVHGW